MTKGDANMTRDPIRGWEHATHRALAAASIALRAVDEMIADGAPTLDEDTQESVDDARAAREQVEAYMEANAPKCPGCREAYAFQRQALRPNRCSWCGYDHDTGEQAQLVPA